ncbi:MAG TPA: N-acetylmuramoyl-L-alanine amidase-like domain-containing protein, partial [Myxococcota bacterium]|nr:N-acetylmuramoyl-L-alanine amidase-like domain-containing protein [Myxococcota bacterium]
RAVGAPRPKERFGDLITRAARVQLGKPYHDAPSPPGPETLECHLGTFQCVSFVESSLALARCIWSKRPDAACFLAELTGLRYRDGQIDGYPSRLHYFEDWLADNARRGRLELITQALGGRPATQVSTYMTAHPDRFPALVDPNVRAAIAAMETRVTAMRPHVVERARVAAVERMLLDGDVVAITTVNEDILVSHTGFITRDPDGVVRLLHASSFRHQVVLSEHDLAQYVLRRPERGGVMVARPLPPAF